MRNDELIDDVARQMTAIDARPAMRARVMASIDGSVRMAPRGWLVPMTLGVATAGAMLVWFMAPSPSVTQDVPRVTQQTRSAVAPPAPASESVDVDRSGSARPLARRAIPAPAADPVVAVWSDAPVPEMPTLPPLTGPAPILIEAITWDDVTIAPIDVALIEVKALEIERLPDVGADGV